MEGEFLDLDLENASLSARFPVLSRFLNPYGILQGGIIAALIDNTIGPLSVLVAPPNVTRFLELKYSSPIKPETDHVTVHASLVDRSRQRLFFKAVVRDPQRLKIATAKASHWILPQEDSHAKK
jgi:acyl-coenzyme A thioesterase PaaI-like protein